MSSSIISIVDYGIGNVASIANMLSKAGFKSELVSDYDGIISAKKLILPGVGAFDKAAVALRETGIRAAVIEAAATKTPLLGVCLGMQLLLERSEEGVEPGLGLIEGDVVRFQPEVSGAALKVPHMGWNVVSKAKESNYIDSTGKQDRYYFVHSYFARPKNEADILGRTKYGVEFASALEKDNVVGVQFHPEKSHRFGLRLLSEFGQA